MVCGKHTLDVGEIMSNTRSRVNVCMLCADCHHTTMAHKKCACGKIYCKYCDCVSE